MTRIEFVDQTLRDGQQSLWGMRMRAGHALPVLDLVNRVGYSVIDVTGSSMFEVQVRHWHENPWEGLDLIREQLPGATLRAGTRSNGAVIMNEVFTAIQARCALTSPRRVAAKAIQPEPRVLTASTHNCRRKAPWPGYGTAEVRARKAIAVSMLALIRVR